MTYPLDIWPILLMALSTQARYGKYIGIPRLKHFKNSLPTDLLTSWIPIQLAIVELLIFKPATWLLDDNYQRDMRSKYYTLFVRISIDYIEIKDLSRYILWYCTRTATEQFPTSSNIGLMITIPTPPTIAMNMLPSDYDAIINDDVINYEMASETSGLRRKYTFEKYSHPG
jgi:hypothetical protein